MARSNAGGRATFSGTNYQAEVAAWLAVRILAEKAASPILGLPADHSLEAIYCETGTGVDDALAETSHGGLLFFQAKRRLALSDRPTSHLASAIGQCVRQYIRCRDGAVVHGVARRRLDAAYDRLVLATHPSSSSKVQVALRDALTRLSHLHPSQQLHNAARNRDEREALATFESIARREWEAESGAQPSLDDLKSLAALIRVFVLDPSPGGAEEREAQDMLRSEVLRRPSDAMSAWNALRTACDHLSEHGDGLGRSHLQEVLREIPLSLKIVVSYREDVERLRQLTTQNLNLLVQHSKLNMGGTVVKIERAATRELVTAACREGGIVVVGEPGSGKSGVIHDFAHELVQAGEDVLLLAANRIGASSLGEIRNEIGLDHALLEALKAWEGGNPAYLIIDALDAARDGRRIAMLRDLIGSVAANAPRWRVIASIRKFDLRYGDGTKRLFAGQPCSDSEAFRDDEFANLRHINVPRLQDDELAQIEPKSGDLWKFVQAAPHPLQELLRTPFNLRLLADLLGAGVSGRELQQARTQLDLLDRYWQLRVIGEDGLVDDREGILLAACQAMVASRSLRASRRSVVLPSLSRVFDSLLRSGVIVEWRGIGAAAPNRDVLVFSHHVLFDYAVARLLLRQAPDAFVSMLREDGELIIAIFPSIVLHLQHVWYSDPSRRRFWNLAEELASDDTLPKLAKTLAPTVAADVVGTPEDLEPLCNRLTVAED